MPDPYQIVYDFGPLPNDEFLDGVRFVLFGLLALALAYRFQHRRTFLIVWGVGALVFGGMDAGFSLDAHNSARWAYEHNGADVIEGQVHVLRREPVHGRPPGDLIEVQGQTFEVKNSLRGPGYRTTLAHGGVLEEGTSVRLLVYEGKILRLEVQRPAAPDPL